MDSGEKEEKAGVSGDQAAHVPFVGKGKYMLEEKQQTERYQRLQKESSQAILNIVNAQWHEEWEDNNTAFVSGLSGTDVIELQRCDESEGILKVYLRVVKKMETHERLLHALHDCIRYTLEDIFF